MWPNPQGNIKQFQVNELTSIPLNSPENLCVLIISGGIEVNWFA